VTSYGRPAVPTPHKRLNEPPLVGEKDAMASADEQRLHLPSRPVPSWRSGTDPVRRPAYTAGHKAGLPVIEQVRANAVLECLRGGVTVALRNLEPGSGSATVSDA